MAAKLFLQSPLYSFSSQRKQSILIVNHWLCSLAIFCNFYSHEFSAKSTSSTTEKRIFDFLFCSLAIFCKIHFLNEVLGVPSILQW
jgi:hypothetical protein